MNSKQLEIVRKINKSIIHEDGTVDSFDKQLIKFISGAYNERFPLVISYNSESIEYIEDINKNCPLIIKVSTVIKLRERHNLGYAFVSECESYLKESVLAFSSLRQETSKIVVLDIFDGYNQPLIAICRKDKEIGGITLNEITSIYDKKNLENLIIESYENNKTFYKTKKTEHYVKSLGFYFPQNLTYALSNNYDKTSFNKSQVELEINRIKQDNIENSYESNIQNEIQQEELEM